VLTRDYTPSYFWWEWVELLRKLLLTGFVLSVPESAAFLRLVAAVLFSVLFLVGQTLLKPFKDEQLQVPSLAARYLEKKTRRCLIFFASPLPVSPGRPDVDPTMDQNRRSG